MHHLAGEGLPQADAVARPAFSQLMESSRITASSPPTAETKCPGPGSVAYEVALARSVDLRQLDRAVASGDAPTCKAAYLAESTASVHGVWHPSSTRHSLCLRNLSIALPGAASVAGTRPSSVLGDEGNVIFTGPCVGLKRSNLSTVILSTVCLKAHDWKFDWWTIPRTPTPLPPRREPGSLPC